jgi:hypothetical protein
MIMGHEFMGVVEETWRDGHNLRKGDRVVVPFPVACGACFFCEHRLPGHCENSNPKYYGPEGALLSEKVAGSLATKIFTAVTPVTRRNTCGSRMPTLDRAKYWKLFKMKRYFFSQTFFRPGTLRLIGLV